MLHSDNLANRTVDAIIYIILGLVALSMLIPFLHVFAISFSTNADIIRGGLMLWPQTWSTTAYDVVLGNPVFLRATMISIFLATAGTLAKLVVTAMMAFSLSRQNLLFRRLFIFLVLIPILFWPGIIPRFLIVKETGLLNSIWSLVIPNLISPFYLFVMMNFFVALPDELFDAAKIDGASDMQVFFRIVIPLSKPVLAAIGLFYAVDLWNSYFGAILFIRDPSLWPIQVLLRLVVLQNRPDALGAYDVLESVPPPSMAVQMATVIIATVPILLVYPFLQRYFVKGLLLGGIKM